MDSASPWTRLVEWLLDLEHIRLGRDAPLSIHWQMDLPLWLAIPLGATVIVAVGIIYRRERGGLSRRVGLAGVRAALISVLVIMLCGPVLRLQRNRREPSQVALLIDRTRSMRIPDGTPDGTTRINVVREALLANDRESVRELLANNQLEIYSFGRSITREAAVADAHDLANVVDVLEGLTCNDTMTDLARAITDVLKQREGGRLAAIVVATDGRSTHSGNIGEAIAAANARQVPVYSIAAGSESPRRDVAVGLVGVAENVFLKDLVAVRVPIEATGLTGPTEVIVRIVDAETGSLIAEQADILSPDRGSREIELHFQPDRAGPRNYRVEIDGLDGEVTPDNNVAQLRVNVLESALRVLYVDGYPRYEYRYLKNTLLREPTIRSSCLLLSADPGFAQEGTDPIRRFPQTLEELSAYDVVLFGDVDVRGDWLSPTQADMLVKFVAERGGGFGVIAGPRHAPSGFRHTPLEKLLPIRIDPEFSGTYATSLEETFPVGLTAEGRQHRMFRFLDQQNPETHLSGLYWIARTLGATPGAEVLAVRSDWLTDANRAPGATGLRNREIPLVVVGRYGAGRVMFVATDDTWRWRRAGGDWVFDTFWLQACRSLMRPASVGEDRRVVLTTNQRKYRYGERVEVRADVFDTEWLAMFQSEMNAVVLDAEQHAAARVTLTRLGENARRFEGSFVPDRAGVYAIELEDVSQAVATRQASVTIRVADADLELRISEADHATLHRLADETGGVVMNAKVHPDLIDASPADPTDTASLASTVADAARSIEDRSIQIPDDYSEPLWDSKLALILFATLIATEWMIRKGFGMV